MPAKCPEYVVSDEAAAYIADALMELAVDFEQTHLDQIRRLQVRIGDGEFVADDCPEALEQRGVELSDWRIERLVEHFGDPSRGCCRRIVHDNARIGEAGLSLGWPIYERGSSRISTVPPASKCGLPASRDLASSMVAAVTRI